MSRIGKKQITIPAGVTITASAGLLTVKGPKGEIVKKLHRLVNVNLADGIASVSVEDEENMTQRALWGTFGSHLKNMITGVTEGYSKKLEVNGVGYKVALKGTNLELSVGLSHPVKFEIPKGIKATVEENVITLEGIDKELVGLTASQVRSIRKPEPYKGKGIKYSDEVIRRKAGKSAAA